MIAAVIVLYHPDLNLLKRLLQSVASQVDQLLVIDNSATPNPDLTSILGKNSRNTQYLPLGENKGIATAHNIGIERAMENGASHVLLLDQDSATPAKMVMRLLAAERALLRAGYPVAAVGPVFIDEKTGKRSTAIRHRRLRVQKPRIDQNSEEPVETDYLIASGCLIRVPVLRQVGLMREELFIDWVDIEWGLRARQLGYKSYIIPKAAMSHSIGDSTVRAVGRDINLHNDIRNYYIVRNATYLLRLKSMGWNWRIITAFKIPQYILFYSWHSNKPFKSLGALLSAFFHGLRGKLGALASHQR